MKVLFVTDIPWWGGSTLSLRDLLSSIGERIEPIVIVYQKDEVYDYMVNAGIRCYVIPYRLSSFQCSHKYLLYPHYIYSIIKKRYYLKKGMREIKALFSEEKIDIVHSNTSAIDFGYDIARALGIKHVWHIREMLETFHNTYYSGGFRRLKMKMKESDKLVFISNACAEYWGMATSNNMIVVGDAVRSKKDVVFNKDKEKYFLFCSYRLSNFKGADVAIRAFGMSNLAKQGYRLKMIGDYKPDYKVELDTISSQYAVSNSVDYIGSVECQQVQAYMANATAYLQCGEMEGLGRTAIEAMFYGCPVIARNCGGTLDFVEHKVTGFLWNTLEECAGQMSYITEIDASDVVLAAQNNVAMKYSIEQYGERMLNLYKSLVP